MTSSRLSLCKADTISIIDIHNLLDNSLSAEAFIGSGTVDFIVIHAIQTVGDESRHVRHSAYGPTEVFTVADDGIRPSTERSQKTPQAGRIMTGTYAFFLGGNAKALAPRF